MAQIVTNWSIHFFMESEAKMSTNIYFFILGHSRDHGSRRRRVHLPGHGSWEGHHQPDASSHNFNNFCCKTGQLKNMWLGFFLSYNYWNDASSHNFNNFCCKTGKLKNHVTRFFFNLILIEMNHQVTTSTTFAVKPVSWQHSTYTQEGNWMIGWIKNQKN